MRPALFLLPWLVFLSASARAQVWTEAGNADSFPDGTPEVTRGRGELTTLDGYVAPANTDSRDAYCIRVTDAADFMATTDAAVDDRAWTTFDSSLFLFRPDGAPVLANEDTGGSTGPGSTLTGVATDPFSEFVLTQPGEYVLVVSHAPLMPKDVDAYSLFTYGDADDVRGPSPSAGRFDAWHGLQYDTGYVYTVVLRGAATCQSDLDVVFANARGNPEKNRVCFGDDQGSFTCQDVFDSPGVEDHYPALSVATGYLDQDPYLDAVFADPGSNDLRCHGRGDGTFDCTTFSTLTTSTTTDVALGFLNRDQYLDMVLANGNNEPNRVCFGLNGSGSVVCSDIDETVGSMRSSQAVALGHLDEDGDLDAVFANYGAQDVICHGDSIFKKLRCSSYFVGPDLYTSLDVALGDVDGDGDLDIVLARNGFKNRLYRNNGNRSYAEQDISVDQYDSHGVAVGHVDSDDHVDLVFANYNEKNRLCLGNGDGTFACRDVSTDAGSSQEVALGLVDGDRHLDAVFANAYSENRLCLGKGDGTFTCSDVSGDVNLSFGVALGELDLSLPLFSDGFESGDTMAWSSSSP